MGPLAGITVLDFSTLLPGPLAALILAEAGARVIKVERPGSGDEMRQFPPFAEGESVLFALLNRGKESVTADLKTEAGRARIAPLLDTADVLIEQFRPGVMDRLGLGAETLAETHPGLVYCSITGYGQTGPDAARAGHDLTYLADTGLLALSMGDPARPVIPPALIADIAGGAYPAVMNILLALEARRRTGRGAHLDVSMTENLFPLMWSALGAHAATGKAPENGSAPLTGASPRYQLYPTADGGVVAAAPLEDRFWRSFCEAIALDPELRDDRRDPEATRAEVARLVAARPAAAWSEVFRAADCCVTVVRDLDAALADPHFRTRGHFAARASTPSGRDLPALPVPLAPVFREAAAEPRRAPPLAADD